ncbi:MAG: geranylgeranyl reductase [Betaproteobacteria bacterium RIFCSPLOWO2_02_FULL_63_19]|nr:MAG: geranylgeranyl reductase [Betaproteobacteria bacterium RIFCSPLOWO2_02_FULL_63_19]
MERCDALVIGGGPAGSTCAGALVREGMDVLVLDRKTFPRDKVCAGWITPAVIETLRIDPADYAARRVLQPITGFRTGMIDGIEVETRYQGNVSYGIRRCEFDHFLLERSRARLRLGEPVRSIERKGRYWIVNSSVETPLLIGAGGHFCPVARMLGGPADVPESVVAAKEVEFAMDAPQQRACSVKPEMPELFFCQDLAGYGWCFRKGDHLNIGLGREDKHGLSQHLEAFCAFLRRRGKIPTDVPDAFHGHAYLLHGRSRRKLADDGVLLIGDAAGLAYPESGEGIRPAVESALLAAATIVEAEQDYRLQRLSRYEQRLQTRLGRTRRANRLPAGLQRYVGGLLLSSAWFTKHVVLDRWFLHAQQGALRAS